MITGAPTGTSAEAIRASLRRRYDALWSSALSRIRAGEVELDPVLRARLPDQRRGLTVIAQPSPGVRTRVNDLLRELRRLEPDQHYYHAAEFHVTVLSLFTATVHPQPFLAQQDQYVAAVDAALANVQPLSITFEGVTVSPGTVMIQGFLHTEGLNRLRDSLRRQLHSRGLGEGADQRYRLETAHMTVVRFSAPLGQAARFVQALEAARGQRFGTTTVRQLTLVQNDWYMSRRAFRILKRYRCRSGV